MQVEYKNQRLEVYEIHTKHGALRYYTVFYKKNISLLDPVNEDLFTVLPAEEYIVHNIRVNHNRNKIIPSKGGKYV